MNPLLHASANLSGRPSPTTFDHVFHDLNHKIDGIVNGDQSEEGLESTVLDCTQFPFRIARPGSVTKEMIEKVLPESVQDIHFTENEKPIAPGMKYKHYSPDTPLTIIENLNHKIDNNEKWKDTAFIFPESMKSLLPESAQFISLCKNAQDIKTANHNLYSILHSIDRSSDIQRAFIFGFEKRINLRQL